MNLWPPQAGSGKSAIEAVEVCRKLPTFGRPHFTVRLERADDPELRGLLAALGPLQMNPGYAKRTGGYAN